MPINKAVVVADGHGNEIIRLAIAKLLKNYNIVMDSRNAKTMTTKTIKGVVEFAKRRGNPIFVQQNHVGLLLKALGFKGYWVFIPMSQNEFSFWYIDEMSTLDIPPQEYLIAV